MTQAENSSIAVVKEDPASQKASLVAGCPDSTASHKNPDFAPICGKTEQGANTK